MKLLKAKNKVAYETEKVISNFPLLRGLFSPKAERWGVSIDNLIIF